MVAIINIHSSNSDWLCLWAQEEIMNIPLPNPSKWPSWHWFTEAQVSWERTRCLSCWPSHIMFTDMKNHISKLAFVQMTAQFLQACCVPLIGPSFNYEMTISQCSIISFFFVMLTVQKDFFFPLLKLDPSTWDGYWIYRGKKRHFKFLLISNNWNIFNIFIRIKSFICKTSPPWAHLINLILSSIDQGIIDLKYFSLKRI